MRAQIPTRALAYPQYGGDFRAESDACRRLLQPLVELAGRTPDLIAGSVGVVKVGRKEYRIPRFIFLGPKGGGDTIRLGLFATFHGDEPEGGAALVRFFQELERAPQAAQGFHIYAYPVCNPAGLAVGRAENAGGSDLTQEFWRVSSQNEVYYLEREMGVHQFQGVVSLHTVRNSLRFAGACRSPVLEKSLLQPALEATHRFLPGRALTGEQPDERIPAGFLTLTDELHPAPFEINLGIPRELPDPSRNFGTIAALNSLLLAYRWVKAFGQNL